MIALALAALLAAGGPASADSPEMAAIFAADQADRRVNPADLNEKPDIDWKIIAPRDASRRAQTKALLTAGGLHTAADYREAAFVYQHGSASDDYLLAHTLATIAVAKGDRSALWIVTATMDRYLMTIGKKQVFGTQFTLPKGTGEPWTQEPFDRALISDALRTELGVPALAVQAAQLSAMEGRRAATKPVAPKP